MTAPVSSAVGTTPVVEQLQPYYKYTSTLTASSSADDKNYLMVPILLRIGPEELLISYKRGYAHMTDREAEAEVISFNPTTERVMNRAHLRRPERNFQNVEFARYANGEIACFVDLQSPGPEDGSSQEERIGATMEGGTVIDGVLRTQAERMGVIEFRSRDGGRTWQDHGKLGLVDGVEYGYVFEAITEGQTTWLLLMTFANLPGGKMIDYERPHAGSVDVIRTDDNGETWQFVRNLTDEFGGMSLNESSFIRSGDGFIVSARSYDDQQWLVRTDGDFLMQHKVNLTETYSFIASYVARPRLFERDGQFYFMGRNWDSSPHANYSMVGHEQPWGRQEGASPMKLSLFRFDPATLVLTKHVILDNAEGENIIDGYYAAPYWQERNGRMLFIALTYKRTVGRHPDILRLEFDWEEVH